MKITPKKFSITKFLSEKYGGNWKYHVGTWHCDDNKRVVMRVRGCSCDDENCGHLSQYWLYGNGTPELVWFYINNKIK